MVSRSAKISVRRSTLTCIVTLAITSSWLSARICLCLQNCWHSLQSTMLRGVGSKTWLLVLIFYNLVCILLQNPAAGLPVLDKSQKMSTWLPGFSKTLQVNINELQDMNNARHSESSRITSCERQLAVVREYTVTCCLVQTGGARICEKTCRCRGCSYQCGLKKCSTGMVKCWSPTWPSAGVTASRDDCSNNLEIFLQPW